MIKDRLEALKAQNSDHVQDDTSGIENDVVLNVDDEGESDMVTFFREVEEVRQMIDTVQDNVNAVRKMHSEILSSSQTDEKVMQNLDDLMASIKKTANKVRTRIKALEEETKATTDPDGGSGGAQQRMKKTQHSTLSRMFVDTMTEYNNVQNNYRDRCKARIQRQLAITGHETSTEELEDMLEKGNIDIFTQGIITETQQARQGLKDIEARHEDIVKLEKSIRDLHDLFMDMAVLVNAQGNLVDSIQRHVEQACRFVDKGSDTIKRAKRFKSNARKKKIIIIICVIVLLLILILVLALTLN
ncbi:syntaxin-1A-like isoform X2 [Panulirus ornatus]|uniref:syntaxin-1A-like isoform X2 n=1 Tax=Panulirus ornatus TaxID=150431 RepID=UPI003A856A17